MAKQVSNSNLAPKAAGVSSQFIQPQKSGYNPVYSFSYRDETILGAPATEQTFTFYFTPLSWYRLRNIEATVSIDSAAANALVPYVRLDIGSTVNAIDVPMTIPEVFVSGFIAVDSDHIFSWDLTPSKPKRKIDLLFPPGLQVVVQITAHAAFGIGDDVLMCFNMQWTRENFKV